MGKKKYYAVRKGKVPGVYESWEECKKVIDGFSGADYKAFGSREEALAYAENRDISKSHKEKAQEVGAVIAYVDGSYSDTAKRYSYGCIMITPEGDIIKKSGYGEDQRALNIRNVAGELQGAMYAVKSALDLGYKRLIIRHDYIGISKWFNGEWKAKDEIVKIYVEYMSKFKNRIEIMFEKVTAHSGDYYNEEADKLAKNAIMLNNKKELLDNEINNSNEDSQREKIINLINDLIMETNEVMEFLGISRQKLTAINKQQKLIPIKKDIYLRIDIENFMKEISEK
ncbi:MULTISPECIES: ribonuclease H family protein [Clostridium]|uniref:ribonuclease H1 domain-containing protein n=1 Tax=Clostridium TaxID=1485 RepID=UPI001EEE2DCD|nr:MULTISPECIES: ribonuclease H family protein [Clostridium]WRY51033.1 ribonuclease H family protein [Clostridium intestinale]